MSPTGWTRRRFLGLVGTGSAVIIGRSLFRPSAVAAAQTSLVPTDPALWSAVEARLRPEIIPRSEWAPDLAPVGPLEAEMAEDVRFLLCHHTAQPNNYGEESIDRYLRDIYRFHTSPDKGWPDIAYNFLIDRFGGIWEGRTGSIDEPIKGSATGGSQGFALLCCWIGNHHEEAPTEQATTAMQNLLAWLSHRYDIDTSPGAQATFTSRGSQIHSKGTDVTTSTIAGHRDMSATVCPGDFAYPLVTDEFPGSVTSLRNVTLAAVTPTTTTSTTTSTTTTSPTTTPTSSAPTAAESVDSRSVSDGSSSITAPATIASSTTSGGDEVAVANNELELTDDGTDWGLIGGAVAGAATIAGAMYWTQNKEQPDDESNA